jgi:hypothetical protein
MSRFGHLIGLILIFALAACGVAEAPSSAAPTAPPAAAPTTSLDTTPIATIPPATDAPGKPTSQADQPLAPCTSSLSDDHPPVQDDPNAVPAGCPTAQGEIVAGPVYSDVVEPSGIGQPTLPGQEVTPTPLQGPRALTFEDRGQTLLLAVGDTFQLRLGSVMTWTVSITDERIVERVLDAPLDAETQGVYKALAPGETTLIAVGDVACFHSRPACMMPIPIVELRIVVR